MKCKFAVSAILVWMLLTASGWTQENGAALYQKKCAACHGAGEGKGKTPALKRASADTDAIFQRITRGAPDSKGLHKKPVAGVDEAQARAIAEFVKTFR